MTSNQDTPITFYTSVRGNKDYRFAVDSSLASSNPCTSFGVQAEVDQSGQPSQASILNWWRTNTLFNIFLTIDNRWGSIINPTVAGDSWSNAPTSPLPTDLSIDNQPYWPQTISLAGSVVLASTVTGIVMFTRFVTLDDNAFLFYFVSDGGTDRWVKISGSSLTTETGATSAPIQAGTWYAVEVVYTSGISAIAVTPIVATPTPAISDFHGGGLIDPSTSTLISLGKFGGPSTNSDTVEVIHYQGDGSDFLSNTNRFQTLNYFWNYYFLKYNLPMVFPTCSQPTLNR